MGSTRGDLGDDALFQERIGYARLREAHPDAPDGALSSVIDVDQYGMPDVQEPEFAGKELVLSDPPSVVPEANAHATRSLRRLCGNPTSIIPAVPRAHSYTAGRWLEGVLRVASPEGPVSFAGSDVRVVSHSWISVHCDPLQAVRRTDAMIDRDGVLQAIASANVLGDFPPMANSYNAIVVGRIAAESSLGPARLDGPGRCKPDLLAPLHSTSQATPCVASAVVLLAESALRQSKPNAAKPYVIKSLLMTGAEKLPSNAAWKIPHGWHRGREPGLHDPGMPLDLRQGAGMLRLDRSYAILQRPESSAGTTVECTGWSCGAVGAGRSDLYAFRLAEERELAATLVWHRHVPRFGTPDDSLLNHLDLHLIEFSGGRPGAAVDRSVSAVDNVEHIYVPRLPAGAYALVVAAAVDVVGTEPYGLSWRSSAPDMDAEP